MEFNARANVLLPTYTLGLVHSCQEFLDVRYDKVASVEGFNVSEIREGDEGCIRHTVSTSFDTKIIAVSLTDK